MNQTRMHSLAENAMMKKENGVVLVIVLWALVLLGIIVGSYLGTIRTDTAIVDNWISTAKAHWAANAGVQLAILKTIEKSNNRWTAGDKEQLLDYGDVRLIIRIFDEAGKVDINHASEELLQALFRSAGVSEEENRSLIAGMMKQRENARQRQGLIPGGGRFGAVDRSDAASGSLYQNIEELAQLPQMRPEIMRAIRSLITTYSGVNGVNPDVASREVLNILPGMEVDHADQFMETRQLRKAQDDSLLGGVKPGYLHNIRGLTLNIQVEALMPDGSMGLSSVILRLDERRRRNKRPYTILEWNEPLDADMYRRSDSIKGVM